MIRFGPFELDLRAGELCKGSARIRLADQPFQVLLILLERPGEVVLREEIQARLWAGSTVVEFDHGINSAVRRLRDALAESADKPRYIETLPRRGYRFIGQVDAATTGAAVDRAATPSIAVLPFVDLSGDKENEYFSDGLAEEIINNLTRVSGLKVIARTSAFAFKGKQEDIRNIAAALGVVNVLGGSVRRVGNRVRVVAQLIAAADGSHLWSQRYDREMSDIFAIQDEIAEAISSALQVQFSAVKPYRPQLPAYDAYLKARYCVAAFTRESLMLSRSFYEQSIALDPAFVEARSGLAVALITSVFPGLSPAQQAMPMARSAAQSALTLDPGSQEAHGALGMIASMYDLNWKNAENQFKTATSREPVPTYVRWYYAMFLLLVGRPRESIEQCVCGLRDDPLSFMGHFHHAAALLAAGDEAGGEAELRELCAIHTNLYQPFYLLGLNQSLSGRHEEALATAQAAHNLAPWNTGTTGLFAGALMRAGQQQAAEGLLQNLLPGTEYGAPLGLLVYSLLCAEIEPAASWAWKVLDQRDPRLVFNLALLRSHRLLRSSESWLKLAARLDVALPA